MFLLLLGVAPDTVAGQGRAGGRFDEITSAREVTLRLSYLVVANDDHRSPDFANHFRNLLQPRRLADGDAPGNRLLPGGR